MWSLLVGVLGLMVKMYIGCLLDLTSHLIVQVRMPNSILSSGGGLPAPIWIIWGLLLDPKRMFLDGSRPSDIAQWQILCRLQVQDLSWGVA